MPLIDGLVTLGAVGIVFLGVLAIRAIRRKTQPEIVGSENAAEVLAQGRRRCRFCRKPTDVHVDVFMEGSWYHRPCFLNQVDEEITK
jgi:hypothetical protein